MIFFKLTEGTIKIQNTPSSGDFKKKGSFTIESCHHQVLQRVSLLCLNKKETLNLNDKE
jgi:hypothetical protein